MDQWLVLKVNIISRLRENQKIPQYFFLVMTEFLFLDTVQPVNNNNAY